MLVRRGMPGPQSDALSPWVEYTSELATVGQGAAELLSFSTHGLSALAWRVWASDTAAFRLAYPEGTNQAVAYVLAGGGWIAPTAAEPVLASRYVVTAESSSGVVQARVVVLLRR